MKNREEMHQAFMDMAIEEARQGIHQAHGGPFGSVIVRDGKVIGKGHNMVLAQHDPTAHGEITAIRQTTKELGSHDLSGTVLYTTGEPCPMCLAACMWANIDKVYYGCNLADNEKIGFRDLKFAKLMGNRQALKDYLVPVGREKCLELFTEYAQFDPQNY